jgi:hypothetical protein
LPAPCRRWASIEPDLNDLANIDDLIAAWRDADRRNQVLLALIWLAAVTSATPTRCWCCCTCSAVSASWSASSAT